MSESGLHLLGLSQWLEYKVVEQVQDYVPKEKHATFFLDRGPLEEDELCNLIERSEHELYS